MPWWSEGSAVRCKIRHSQKIARKQRDFVTGKLIQPFLEVMRKHHNPGVEECDGIGLGWDLLDNGDAKVFKVGVGGQWRYAIYYELSSKPHLLGHNKIPRSPLEPEHLDCMRLALQDMLVLHSLPTPFSR